MRLSAELSLSSMASISWCLCANILPCKWILFHNLMAVLEILGITKTLIRFQEYFFKKLFKVH